MTKEEVAEKEEFEDWADSEAFSIEMVSNVVYKSYRTTKLWECWQASRRTLRAKQKKVRKK